MKQTRWYDENPDLKNLFELIKRFDKPIQNIFAQDILQIIMTDFNVNLDGKINTISKNYNYKCSRWYDQNIDLFTSFEIIKSLSIEEQALLIEKITASILLTYLAENRPSEGEL